MKDHTQRPGAAQSLLAVPPDRSAWLVALAAVGLVLPTLWGLMAGGSAAYSRGHEPLLLGVAAWLMWRQRDVLRALPRQQPGWLAAVFLGCTLMAYVFGRTQEFIRIEMLSLWLIGMQLVWWFKGWAGLRQTWFVWLFALFVLPLPFSVVLALTEPLKLGVSALAAWCLQAVGYPVGRQGVVLTVGQYQLLVAEACAGLHSMFVLEAMGLLYSHLAAHSSRWRNLLLAVMAVPVAFVANVLRVMLLVLITYHLGDAVGQGFLHRFAGVVLFALALVLMAAVDVVLGRVWPDEPGAPGRVEVDGGLKEGGKHASRASLMSRRDMVLAALMLAVAMLCGWWRLSVPEDDARRESTPLEALVPSQFGVWRLDPITMGLVRPAVDAAKAYEMYDQILERVYLNDLGERVMVSVAYGRRQSVGLQMHRPEVCYRSGGFEVSDVGSGLLSLGARQLPVTRLVAQVPGRHEPITYWRLLGDHQVGDERDFKWTQLQLGLARRIPDGLLFRVSSLDTVPQRGWALQARFIRELDAALTPGQRQRLLGLPLAGAASP